MARPQKTLKFKEENIDVYEILCNQENYTQYVCDAVRHYNKKPLDKPENDEMIQEIRDSLKRIETLLECMPNESEDEDPINLFIDNQLIKQILNEDD